VGDTNTYWAAISGETAMTAIVSQFLYGQSQSGTVARCGCFCVDVIDSTLHAKTVDDKTNSGAVTKTCYVAHLGLLFCYSMSIL